MKLDILDMKGNSLEKIDLMSNVFEVKADPSTISQYIRTYLLNQRQGTSSTKTRGEVSGGGKKPWKQKGTGRARQGSIRSPIWVHGGTAHGPKPKDWGLKTTRSIRDLVLKAMLSDKCDSKKIVVVDKYSLQESKTKKVVEMLTKLGVEGKILLVWSKRNDSFLKCTINIPGLDLVDVKLLNPYQIMNSDYLVLDKESINYLQKESK